MSDVGKPRYGTPAQRKAILNDMLNESFHRPSDLLEIPCVLKLLLEFFEPEVELVIATQECARRARDHERWGQCSKKETP